MRSININTIESFFLQKLLIQKSDQISSRVVVYADEALANAAKAERDLCEQLIRRLQGRPNKIYTSFRRGIISDRLPRMRDRRIFASI